LKISNQILEHRFINNVFFLKLKPSGENFFYFPELATSLLIFESVKG
jgi:hypothetical protein